MLEEGRLVESLRPDVGALVAGRDELGRGDVVAKFCWKAGRMDLDVDRVGGCRGTA